MVQSTRHVKQALIASGHDWMDAAPEIASEARYLCGSGKRGWRPTGKEAILPGTRADP